MSDVMVSIAIACMLAFMGGIFITLGIQAAIKWFKHNFTICQKY